jgi:ferredoxin-thioredoxin reductase catalytic chain
MKTLDQVRRRAEVDAGTFGYLLTPDADLLEGLLDGLKVNEERYGYPSCPCRLASGKLELDRDIICPCDYRDIDVAEFGACYCRLYVSKSVHESKDLPIVPERRPLEKQMKAFQTASLPSEQKPVLEKSKVDVGVKEEFVEVEVGKQKFWYCKQCGYVVFREDPPYVCPICKAKRELFAEIKTQIAYTG